MNYSKALPRPPKHIKPDAPLVIGVLAGEGIGPEVVPLALELLEHIAEASALKIELRQGGLIGKPAIAHHGVSLSDEVVDFCANVFAEDGALFCGAGGDRFVYELRARFDLFCKFTPLRPQLALRDTGAIRPEMLDGVDIVAVRENTGGMYLGQWSTEESAQFGRVAHHSFSYRQAQVERIVEVALRLAQARRRILTVTTKPGGVPAVSALWQDVAAARCEAAGVRLRVLEIDNAVYQLIADPRQFDVVVSPNMFGDVMADCGSLLLGSRGMSFSGNFTPHGHGVFQTGHGAAHDLAGSDRANPVGQILALAMMLRESFQLEDEAAAIEHAVADTLAQGYRTPDIAGPESTVLGTRALGCKIRNALIARLRESPHGNRAA